MKELMPYFFVFIFAFCGCGSDKTIPVVNKTDLEIEVINDLLPELLPKRTMCTLVPKEGEPIEEFRKRLKAFQKEIDSIGKKLEIVRNLEMLDDRFMADFEQSELFNSAPHLLNAPRKIRHLDSTMFRPIENIKIVLVTAPKKTIGSLTDCYTLGELHLSRVGFNKDSTKAAFRYYIYNGSCFVENQGIVNAELKNEKWEKLKNH